MGRVLTGARQASGLFLGQNQASAFYSRSRNRKRRRCALVGAPRPYAGRPAARGYDQLARTYPLSQTIQLAPVLTRTGQPGPRHICTLTVALSTCPHTRLPPTMECKIGPLTLSSGTATVLAHGPVLGPAPPHHQPSCPAAPPTGPSRTIRHPGQRSTSPPQPGAALRFSAPPLFGAALVHACLCSSLHRCTRRTTPLSMRSAAPFGSA